MIKLLLKRLGLIPETKEEKSKRISLLIENDPVLKKLDKEIAALNERSGKLNPEFVKILKKYGAY